MIKVIVGNEEMFETKPGEAGPVAVNVFHVNKSFLIQHSKYFAILLDTAPPREVIRLQAKDPVIVEDWLNVLYRDERVDGKLFLRGTDQARVRDYLDFADLVGSHRFKNWVMDEVQAYELFGPSLEMLRSLRTSNASMSKMTDFVVECVAHKIVSDGWAAFTCSDRDKKGNAWNDFVGDKANIPLLNRLILKVDDLLELQRQGKCVCPYDREDCKWHEHPDEQDEKACRRKITASL